MTWTTRSIITKLTCATFSGAHLYVIHLISDLPSPSSSLVCSTAHWCPDAKCVCSSGLELKRCRKPHIRSHKIYTHTEEDEEEGVWRFTWQKALLTAQLMRHSSLHSDESHHLLPSCSANRSVPWRLLWYFTPCPALPHSSERQLHEWH